MRRIRLKGSVGILPAPRCASTHLADVATKSSVLVYARSPAAASLQLNRQRRLFYLAVATFLETPLLVTAHFLDRFAIRLTTRNDPCIFRAWLQRLSLSNLTPMSASKLPKAPASLSPMSSAARALGKIL